MKILYCLAGTFNSGGMERIVISKANWLAEKGHKVSIVTTEQNSRPNFFPIDKSISRIDLDIMYSENVSNNPIKKYWVRRNMMNRHRKMMENIVNKEKPDIVISTFGNEVSFIPFLKGKSKKIAEIHFSRWYRLQLNRKGIWKLIDLYLTRQDKLVLSKYDKFVCLTEEDKENWNNQKKIVVIPNFIDSVSENPAELKSKKMIAVGRLSYQKGYDRLIKAWKFVSEKHPEWKLDIYGGGEEKENLTFLIDSLNLHQNISINNPTNAINTVYRNASALILSSHYEGLPMVLLEAMSNGLPVVAYSCQCGPKDVITNQKDGILVEEGDISGLAKAIMELMESEDKRIRMGENAYIRAREFTKEKIMPKWISLFDDIVEK